jgi:prepilin-type N-terminal cleavage/methylation domain-containing protein
LSNKLPTLFSLDFFKQLNDCNKNKLPYLNSSFIKQHTGGCTMRNNKGFTLVEMAIVLVIIGIILGAVIKGQDLIDNARAKQFINQIRQYQLTSSTYYDRKGRYPGDADKNGIIGDGDAKTDITNAKFVAALNNPFTLGQNSYYLFYGNTGGTSPKNILLVCPSATCTGIMNTEALKYAEALDTAIDGSVDATTGNIYGIKTAGTVLSTALWTVTGATASVTTTKTEWLDPTAPEAVGIVYVMQ